MESVAVWDKLVEQRRRRWWWSDWCLVCLVWLSLLRSWHLYFYVHCVCVLLVCLFAWSSLAAVRHGKRHRVSAFLGSGSGVFGTSWSGVCIVGVSEFSLGLGSLSGIGKQYNGLFANHQLAETRYS